MAQGQWGGNMDQRIFRVKINWLAAQQKCQTGFYLRDVGLNTLAPDEVADHVSTWVTAQFPALLHSSDRLISTDVENVVTRQGHSVEYNNLPGANAGQRTPTFLMVPVSLRGELRRRYGQGRMLWPVSTEDLIDGQELNAAGKSDYAGTAALLAARYIGSSLTHSMRLCNVHDAKVAYGNRPALPAMWYDVTSIRVNTLLSSIRRRKSGVGA